MATNNANNVSVSTSVIPSVILALGDSILLEKLFDKIRDQLKSSKTYQNSPNKIEIAYTTSTSSNLNASFKLKISTKYYDSELDVRVVAVSADHQPDDFVKNYCQDLVNLEAILIMNQHLSLFNSKSFQAFIENNKSCLNLLINGGDNDLEIFEDFIKLNINLSDGEASKRVRDDDDDEEEEEDEEYSDLDDLINSLFVHSWNNMKIKNVPNKKEMSFQNAADVTGEKLSIEETNQMKKIVNNETPNEKNKKEASYASDDSNICKETNDVDGDDEFNFENLLMNLNDLRGKASNLSFEERKKFAENVVKNFWKSMGGDEDEIAGLDDDEDED